MSSGSGIKPGQVQCDDCRRVPEHRMTDAWFELMKMLVGEGQALLVRRISTSI